MNYRVPMLLCLSLAMAGLLAGCATKRPQVETWRNPQFSPSRTTKLALTERPNPSPHDATLGRLLVAELQRGGYAVVPPDQADYLLTYVVADSIDADYRSGAHVSVMSAPAQTSYGSSYGYYTPIGGPGRSVPATIYADPVIYHTRDLRLCLYTNPKTHAGNFQMAWQGSIAAGLSEAPDRDTVLIRTLLGYLGKEQNGRVDLAP